MQITQLLRSDEERAVSPVIGVILMVAITVILAAVIGTFALGLGDQVRETSPNAQFSGDQGTMTIDDIGGAKYYEISHNSGQDVDPSEVEVTVNGDPAIGATEGNDSKKLWGSGDDISASSSITIVGYYSGGSYDSTVDGNESISDGAGDFDGDYNALNEGDTVRIVWSSGSQSDTLHEYEVN